MSMSCSWKANFLETEVMVSGTIIEQPMTDVCIYRISSFRVKAN